MDRSPLWWMKRGKKAPKKAGSPGLSVALILAWTFGYKTAVHFESVWCAGLMQAVLSLGWQR